MHSFEHLRYLARSDGASQKALVYETAEALLGFNHDPAGLLVACRRLLDRQPGSGPLLWLAARALAAADLAQEIRDCVAAIADDATVQVLERQLPIDAKVCVLGYSELVASSLRRRGDASVLVVDVLGEAAQMVRRLLRTDQKNSDRVHGDRKHRDAQYQQFSVHEVAEFGLGAATAASDLLILESAAVGPHEFLAVAGSVAAASVAHTFGVPVWLVASTGTVLPEPMWAALLQRCKATGANTTGQLDAAGAHDTLWEWEAEMEVVPLRLVDQLVGTAGAVSPTQVMAISDCPVVPDLLQRPVRRF